MSEITDVKCKDGKRHYWEEIYEDLDYGVYSRESWCTKCGSLTEFTQFRGYNQKWKRCKDGNKYYIKIPGQKKKRLKKEESIDEAHVEV